METINPYFILGIVMTACCIATILWLTKPTKCPKCGEIMKQRKTMLNGVDFDYLYCIKCGHMEQLNINKKNTTDNGKPSND